MRVGIFTDTYHPVINGITYVVDETKRELEALGHDVYIICPSSELRRSRFDQDNRILYIPAIKDVFYEDQMTSYFFPSLQVKRIRELKLDVIEFTTPGQIGMLGVYAALKNLTPLVAMYCTDLYEYVRHYPKVVPAVIAQVIGAPITLGARAPELRRVITSLPARQVSEHWSQTLVAEMLTILHNRCQAVVTPSRKVKQQLLGWNTTTPIHVIPTGVTPIPVLPEETQQFRERWGLTPGDKVILSVGRLGSEKNLELPIKSFDAIKAQVATAKLVIVGNSNQHQETLEALAAEQEHGQDIVFTGSIPRNELGSAYDASDVFVFPSQTDTQGLVLHEAAQSGLPLVVCDPEVTEILEDGKNGYFARNDSADFADQVVRILQDQQLAEKMGAASREIVARYSADIQASKLLDVFQVAVTTGRNR